MSVDPELLAARIARIREMLSLASRAESIDADAFEQDAVLRAAVERGLQVAIEGCLDIGHHVIARLGLRRPAEYREVFEILGEAGAIERELARKLAEAAQLRNRLVHLYWDVDPGRIHEIASHDLDDLRSLPVCRRGALQPGLRQCRSAKTAPPRRCRATLPAGGGFSWPPAS